MGDNLALCKIHVPYTENELVYQLRLKNEKAFNYLYTAYSQSLLTRIKDIIGCSLTSEELLHNSFLKIWLNMHKYNSEKSSLFTWMNAIARNESIDYLRSGYVVIRMLTDPIDTVQVKAETFIAQRLDHKYVLNALVSLPFAERKILELYSVGYTCSEISELLSLPIGTVKSKMRKSYIILREKLYMLN